MIGDQPQKTTWSDNSTATLVEGKANQATRALGAGLESLGCTIRTHEPDEGVLHAAGEAIAAKLERGGRYLETHGLSSIGKDLTNLVRRNPIPALLLGLGAGLVLARLVRK
jgi:hypothetical protein